MAKKFNKALARKLNTIIADGLNMMAERLNKTIQEGIDKGVDIKGKAFKPLGPAVTSVRGSGAKILDDEGRMRKTKIIKATPENTVARIRMAGRMSKGKYVGAMHNKGYTVSAGRFKGSIVPKRNWFGMTDSMKPGGKDNSVVIGLIKIKLRNNWKN